MFPETIIKINEGGTVAELSSQLKKLVEAVCEHGKGGTLTLTVKVKPASEGSTEVVMVEAAVKTKLPEPERGTTIFFVTQDHNLVRNDPKQMVLPALRVVELEQPQREQLKEVI